MRLTPMAKGEFLDEFWYNPVDAKVYKTFGQPDHGFKERDSYPVFDVALGYDNTNIIKNAMANGTYNQNLVDGLQNASLDADLTEDLLTFDEHLRGGRVKEAALLSNQNPGVDVVRIYPQLYGLKDRSYSGLELARRVATEDLILNFDKIKKMEGLEEIPEMGMPRQSQIQYERQRLETKKYGLMIRISEESIRKNVHNPYQDSITVAGTKRQQRQSYDVIKELDDNLTSVTPSKPWDTYITTGNSRSANDPTRTLTAIVTQTIQATNVGGKWDKMGLHQIGHKIYESNTFLNGVNPPVPTAQLAPGTTPTKGFSDVTTVMDNFVPQGDAFLVDTSTEATCIFLEGPSRIATKIDEFLKTQNYAIIDYHLAFILNKVTGRKVVGAYTAVSPAGV